MYEVWHIDRRINNNGLLDVHQREKKWRAHTCKRTCNTHTSGTMNKRNPCKFNPKYVLISCIIRPKAIQNFCTYWYLFFFSSRKIHCVWHAMNIQRRNTYMHVCTHHIHTYVLEVYQWCPKSCTPFIRSISFVLRSSASSNLRLWECLGTTWRLISLIKAKNSFNDARSTATLITLTSEVHEEMSKSHNRTSGPFINTDTKAIQHSYVIRERLTLPWLKRNFL